MPVQQRGGCSDLDVRAHAGDSRRRLMHIFDPDGSRAEFMEPAVQDTIPSMAVMAPGPEAPPMLPSAPRTIPWP